MMGISDLLQRCREIAEAGRAAMAQTEVDVPLVRRVAGDIDHAGTLAEYTGKPVDICVNGSMVTVYPIGQTPPCS